MEIINSTKMRERVTRGIGRETEPRLRVVFFKGALISITQIHQQEVVEIDHDVDDDDDELHT